jgi:hypothetical protein
MGHPLFSSHIQRAVRQSDSSSVILQGADACAKALKLPRQALPAEHLWHESVAVTCSNLHSTAQDSAA